MSGVQGGLQPSEHLLQPLVRDGHVAALIQPQGRLIAVGRRQGSLQMSAANHAGLFMEPREPNRRSTHITMEQDRRPEAGMSRHHAALMCMLIWNAGHAGPLWSAAGESALGTTQRGWRGGNQP